MKLANKRQRPYSLAARVTILVGVTIFVCLTFIHYMVQESISEHFKEQDADELNEVFSAVKRKLFEAHAQGVPPSSILFQAVSGHHGVYYLVKDEIGNKIFASDGADLFKYSGRTMTTDRVTPSSLVLFNDGSHILRATEIVIPAGELSDKIEYSVVVASNMEFHINYMNKFEKTLLGIVLLAGIITIFVARFSVYRGLSPLRKLSRKIESITADKLDVRIDPEEVPVELVGLAGSFNAMIKRLEDGFERLSHFSADIAHELRTPITNLTTQTQVILSQPRKTEEYADILYSNLEEYERMTKIVSDMLLLAQTEHGLIKPNSEHFNSRKEIDELIEYFSLLAEEKHITIEVNGPDLVIYCDKSMFRQALSNLLSNAIRFAPTESTVEIKITGSSREQRICISNPGEQIPAAQLPRLFDRFYRADPARKRDGQGAGLGLTIARSLLQVNGGHIAVSSTSDVTTFCMTFGHSSTQI